MEFIHPMAIIKTNDYVQTIFNYQPIIYYRLVF
jgi:hypothetical protein